MFRGTVAMFQRVIGRTLLRRARPMTRWGSLSRFPRERSLRSRSCGKRSTPPRKLGLSLRSSLARPAPLRGLPRPRTPAPTAYDPRAPSMARYAALYLRGLCFGSGRGGWRIARRFQMRLSLAADGSVRWCPRCRSLPSSVRSLSFRAAARSNTLAAAGSRASRFGTD
jgi:hypothetical protein